MGFLADGYPEIRYTEEKGEVSAEYRAAGTPPDYTAPGGTEYHYLSTRLSTDGLFGLYKNRMGPAPAGTGTHFHTTMSESFFVLSGWLRAYDGERWVDLAEGDYLYVPPGGLHAFGNISGAPAEFLMLFAPGGAREGYFEGLRHMAEMTDTERTEFLVRHDSFFTDRTGPDQQTWADRAAELRR